MAYNNRILTNLGVEATENDSEIKRNLSIFVVKFSGIKFHNLKK